VHTCGSLHDTAVNAVVPAAAAAGTAGRDFVQRPWLRSSTSIRENDSSPPTLPATVQSVSVGHDTALKIAA
jgi:hypothetical protein